MCPCVKIAVSRRRGDQWRMFSCTALAWNTPLVSTTTSPSSVSTAAELANASTNATRGCTSASFPLDANGWCDSIGSAPVNRRSASSSTSRSSGIAAVSHRRPPGCLAAQMETCFNSLMSPAIGAASEPESTLARSQAERRRRVLAATFELAAEGGFDAVQMRDVAAAADVALGTVYRYFSSKERLLLEAMAEQQADLRAYIETHPLSEATAPERVMAVLRRANRSLRRYPDVTAAMVRAFGSAQTENGDIVRRVTEIMTAIITRAVQGSDTHPPTAREV